jgi:hypothetical protein
MPFIKKETVMSIQKENNTKEIKYFSSAHAETGFLNSLTLVESKGSDYYAVKFNARRGNSKEPLTAPHSVRINGVQAKEVIAQIADKVNAQLVANKKLWGAKRGKEAATISITLNISDTIAKSYMNKHTGKDVVYIDGRCTSIAYVRIGDEVIFQKDAPVKADATKQVVETEADAKVDQTGEMVQRVTLDPEAEDFQERKAELKNQGYFWDKDNKVWSLQ